jgi:hypothetical protein
VSEKPTLFFFAPLLSSACHCAKEGLQQGAES